MTAVQTRKVDSGEPWIGQIPAHWKLVDLKYLTQFINGCAFKPTDWQDDGIPIIRIVNLNGGEEFNYTVRDVDPRYVVNEGDLLFGWSGNKGTSFGPFVWWREGKHYLNQHIFRLGGFKLHKRYFYWLLVAVTAHVESQTSGIIGLVHVTKEDLGNISVPLAPEREQHGIAEFLDRKTTQIDGVITKKQRMIDLLHEKRKALISEAVTKGLDPDVPTKDSGIEWVGRVPKHWSVERLKYSITKIEQGWSPQCDNRPAEDDEWGVLKVGCGNGDEFDPSEQKALPLDVAPMPEYEIRSGDILMSRGNTRELVGAASLVKNVRHRLMLCDLLYRFHAQPRRADAEFLVFSLRSPHVRFQIEREASGTSASMKKVGQETIRELVVCLPPVDEQKTIITRLRPLLDQHDQIVHRIESQITKLREYRQTLISAAVTGLIDVSKEVV